MIFPGYRKKLTKVTAEEVMQNIKRPYKKPELPYEDFSVKDDDDEDEEEEGDGNPVVNVPEPDFHMLKTSRGKYVGVTEEMVLETRKRRPQKSSEVLRTDAETPKHNCQCRECHEVAKMTLDDGAVVRAPPVFSQYKESSKLPHRDASDQDEEEFVPEGPQIIDTAVLVPRLAEPQWEKYQNRSKYGFFYSLLHIKWS